MGELLTSHFSVPEKLPVSFFFFFLVFFSHSLACSQADLKTIHGGLEPLFLAQRGGGLAR